LASHRKRNLFHIVLKWVSNEWVLLTNPMILLTWQMMVIYSSSSIRLNQVAAIALVSKTKKQSKES
jgi:hypothetical protein